MRTLGTPNFVWNCKCPLRQIRPSLVINQLPLRYVINAEKAFKLNCFHSRLPALMYTDNMIMGKNRGERILNSISVCQRIKNWFQGPTYIRRLNDYPSTRYTSLKWHRNKTVVAEMNLLLCLLRISRELQHHAKSTPALGESDYSASSHGRITSGESPRYSAFET